MELVYVECEPGDAIFFDCNLLHRSDMNASDEPRWSLICCYNAGGTTPTRNRAIRAIPACESVADDAIRRWQKIE